MEAVLAAARSNPGSAARIARVSLPPLLHANQIRQTGIGLLVVALAPPFLERGRLANFGAGRSGAVPLAIYHPRVRRKATTAIRAFFPGLFFVSWNASPAPCQAQVGVPVDLRPGRVGSRETHPRCASRELARLQGIGGERGAPARFHVVTVMSFSCSTLPSGRGGC